MGKLKGIFLIIIPIGMVILFFVLDFSYKIYEENKLDHDAREAFKMALDREGLETNEDMTIYIEDKLSGMGYTDFDISLTDKDEYKLLVVYNSYFSVVNQLLRNGSKMSVVRLKGHYNEFKETVIESYKVDEDDNLIEEVDTTSTTSKTTKKSIVREAN